MNSLRRIKGNKVARPMRAKRALRRFPALSKADSESDLTVLTSSSSSSSSSSSDYSTSNSNIKSRTSKLGAYKHQQLKDEKLEDHPTTGRGIARVRFASGKNLTETIPSSEYSMTSQEQEEHLWYTQEELGSQMKQDQRFIASYAKINMFEVELKAHERAYWDIEFLSTTLSHTEADKLIRDDSAVAKHAKAVRTISTTILRGMETWMHGSLVADARATNAHDVRKMVLDHSASCRAYKPYDPEDKRERLAMAYREKSRSAMILARIMAEIDHNDCIKDQIGATK